ncbi:tRNA (adenosine(37)-N6)-threonylcarbamoyltransferase complex dimerization subunit type 1 TsaB [Phaeodactylibacter luteus]|uniref:tRNA (Adenosine(37)-N6)-threonylcarbamoyltransferase complex dimerization subunit type 1 TsaB n=1 Tax=Phaeodactylibacter luteus TaxID=1564516 RepID=A0A5C6RKU7_9BACT|nr:tRNA (adenosine(37)-N6)-threonylcarbamoyltransferase complex dimerization subunit type 1 TsaB [Phaeodactylibacter luteus]TXB63008.1 tRNA (adenosine(37)-N6)-threonylcarbamoyltransferase complex dimerization subunit type 1 TsaB [Phaeodactylibacter luteus]
MTIFALMARILLLETATDTCSVALGDGLQVIARKDASAPRQHAAEITLLIDACLKEAGWQLPELDAVALSSGPGSYTSLRVGTSVAKGICYALDKPMIAVDTLQALALASLQAEREEGVYFPMIDARRMEVYTAPFDAQNAPQGKAEAVIMEAGTFEEWHRRGIPVILSGNGAEKCRAVLPEDGVIFSAVGQCAAPMLLPLALRAFEAGAFSDTAYYSPFYLKPPNVTVSKKKLL